MKKKLPIILLGVILACVLVFGFLYANSDIGKTANSLEADIRQSQKILDDWIVDGKMCIRDRFFVKPNLLQCHSSYVVTDPKGTILNEVGALLERKGYRIKSLNLINFKKSMRLSLIHICQIQGTLMQHFPGGISPLRMLLHGW